MPTESQIQYLRDNPEYATTFNLLFGEGASNQYISGAVAQTPEATTEQPSIDDDKKRGLFTDVPLQIVGGVRDAINEAGQLAGNVNDSIDEVMMDYGIGGGFATKPDGSFGYITNKKRKEIEAENGQIKSPVFGYAGIDDTVTKYLPEVDKADTMTGAFVRPVAQFGAGFFTGGKILKGAKVLQGASTGTKITQGIVKGAFADFTVFDEHTARLSDLAVDYGIDNELTNYLASDPTDTWAEGKFKLALEGAFLGGAVETIFLGFRRAKNLYNARKKGDEKAFKEIDEIETTNINESVKKESVKAKNKRLDELDKKKKTLENIDAKQGTTKKNADDLRNYFDEGFEQDFKNLDDKLQAWRRGDINPNTNKPYQLGEVLDETFASGKWQRNSTDGSILVLNKIFENLKKNLKGVKRTDEEVIKQAEKLGLDPNDVLSSLANLSKEMKDADVKQLAGNMTVNSLADSIGRIANKVKRGESTIDDFDKVYHLLETLLTSVNTVSTGGSRILRVQKIAKEGNDVLNPDTILQWTKFNNEYKWRPSPDGKKILIDKLSRIGNDQFKVIQFIKSLGKLVGIGKGGKIINGLNEAFVNAILSNPKTHLINMISNTFQATITPLEMILGGALRLDSVSVREGVDTYVGLSRYWADSLRYANMSLKSGDNFLDDVTKIDMDYQKAIPTVIGDGIRLPSRFLGAEDEFFKQLNFRAKAYARSMQLARLEAKNGQIKQTDIPDRMAKIFDDAVIDGRATDTQTGKYALDYAQTNTFTKKLDEQIKGYDGQKFTRSALGSKVQDAVNALPILRQFVPFIRTPVNIMREVWKRTPAFNLLHKEFRTKLTSGNPSERAEAMGQFALGTAMYYGAYELAKAGKITGGGSKDPFIRKQHIATGWKPYSFKVGDKYVSYERLDPWGMFFGVIGDFNEIAQDLEQQKLDTVHYTMFLALQSGMDLKTPLTTIQAERILQEQFNYGINRDGNSHLAIFTSGVGAVVQNLTSKTYLKGVGDLIEALQSGEDGTWEKFWNQKAGSFVPNIVKNVQFDKNYREVRTILDALKKGVPYYNDQLEPKYDVTGRKIVKTGNYLDGLVNPISITKKGTDTVLNEIARLDTRFEPLDTTVGTSGNIDLLEFKNAESYKMNNGTIIPEGVTSHYAMNLILENGRMPKFGKKLTLNEAIEHLINSKKYKTELTDSLTLTNENTFEGTRVEAIRNIVREYRKFAEKEIVKSNQWSNEGGIKLEKAIHQDKVFDKKRNLVPSNTTAEEYLFGNN